MDYRFRTEGDLLVLQVGEYVSSPYSHERGTSWRDAKVEDVPVFQPFTPPPEEKYSPDATGPVWKGLE